MVVVPARLVVVMVVVNQVLQKLNYSTFPRTVLRAHAIVQF